MRDAASKISNLSELETYKQNGNSLFMHNIELSMPSTILSRITLNYLCTTAYDGVCLCACVCVRERICKLTICKIIDPFLSFELCPAAQLEAHLQCTEQVQVA